MNKLFTEAEVLSLFESGVKSISVHKGDIITPLGFDKIKSLGMDIINNEISASVNQPKITATKEKDFSITIAICSDSDGFKIKQMLINYLKKKKININDVGTYNEEPADYSDFAISAALKVKEKTADYGILIDATGVSSAIIANKIKGIRAAACYDIFSAKNARTDLDANILTLGAKTLGEETIKLIVETWLDTEFSNIKSGHTHIDKITAIENKAL
jgi:ribose 5-phosphate isomerase B